MRGFSRIVMIDHLGHGNLGSWRISQHGKCMAGLRGRLLLRPRPMFTGGAAFQCAISVSRCQTGYLITLDESLWTHSIEQEYGLVLSYRRGCNLFVGSVIEPIITIIILTACEGYLSYQRLNIIACGATSH